MKSIRSLALLALLSPAFLVATEENRIAPGSRTPSEEPLEQIIQILENEEEMCDAAGYIQNKYPPVYYSQSHHWISAITVHDNNTYTIELEDGSVWKVHQYDGLKALNWRANDPLTITQNNRWFTSYNFRILNKATGTSIEANLHQGPYEFGQYSRYIIGIDHAKSEIVLSDDTRWEVSYLDLSTFKNWAYNDYVIIGTNSETSFWDSSSNVLLINVNLTKEQEPNTVRAKQL